MIRVLFFGTSPFAVPSLEALATDGRFQIVGVVTQPDRPVGRHAKLTPPPIKIAAQRLNLPIYQFASVKQEDALKTFADLQPELGVVVSFGQILPQALLDIPRHGMVNVHGSLLPKYRGASPIHAAILAGDTETGVTIMKLDRLMDHGPILKTATEPIRLDDTSGTLHDRLARLGGSMLAETLIAYTSDRLIPQEQNHAQATAVKLLKREHGLIDWSQSAAQIERMVRAHDPWPGTYTLLDGKRLKILQATCESITDYPTRACGDGKTLTLVRVQLEGKPPMDGRDFQHGHNIS